MTLWTLHHADCRDSMRTMEAEFIDSIVTDPPYGLSFMGKNWDHGVPGVPFWTEALRVAKPGAHLVAFGGTRTFHRLAVAIEDAGWEIRDCLSWIYGSGFPKSKNLDGAWQGWGTALKPAWEPIILARKPLIGTVAENVVRHGTGAINVDACRIETADSLNGGAYSGLERRRDGYASADGVPGVKPFSALRRGIGEFAQPSGRWPANVALDEEAAELLGEPSRFFYTAKASRRERGEGNTHPTVKPVALMRWLVRLVTPTGGTVLDPFNGSGSTGVAALAEGMRYVGCEREAEYIEIARRRLESSHAQMELL